MQITETLADGLKHDFRVVVPAEDLHAEVDRKLAEYGAGMRLPGFRPRQGADEDPAPALRAGRSKEKSLRLRSIAARSRR